MLTVEQAAVNALCIYLRSKLSPTPVPALKIQGRWPEDNRPVLPIGITVSMAGPREDEMVDPQMVASVPTTGQKKLYTWRIRSSRQPLQLDVWTQYEAARDDLVARLDTALNTVTTTAEPAHGVSLPLLDGWAPAITNIWFEGPQPMNPQDDQVQRTQYRTMFLGTAVIDVTVQAETARMASIVLKNPRLNP